MISITELTVEEIKYLCDRITPSGIRSYFQKYPKGFAEIRKGFRPDKLSDDDTVATFMKNYSKQYISNLIEGYVSIWMEQIDENCKKLESEGYTKGESLLKTMPDSVFDEKIALYFKLNNIDNKEYVNLVEDALSLIKKTEEDMEENKEVHRIEERDSDIEKLKEALSEKENECVELKAELNDISELVEKYRTDTEDLMNRLSDAEGRVSEMQPELEHYRFLETYSDKEYIDNSDYHRVSVGVISHDMSGQTWINRMADIVDGIIYPFHPDEDKPKYFDNRDKLFWKDGPSEDGAFGVWGWKVNPRDTDPSKDYVISEYQKNIHLTEIVEMPLCQSLNDLAGTLTEKFDRTFSMDRVLFTYTTSKGIKEGLLCSIKDFEIQGNQVRLLPSIVSLRKYTINSWDYIDIAGKVFIREMNLGMPQGVFKVRSPLEVVKKIIIERVTVPSLRETGLTKKEAQHCLSYLKELPVDSLVQNVADVYDCKESDAKGYIEDFIEHSDSYLTENDLDLNVISDALTRNAGLIDKCKSILKEDWEREHGAELERAQDELRQIEEYVIQRREEGEELKKQKDEMKQEIETIDRQIAEKEKLAIDVEDRIATRIEEAKENAADFISKMAFVSDSGGKHVSNGGIGTSLITYEYDDAGSIDDMDSFEEELAENIESCGYKSEVAIEMGQAISFCMCNKIPVIVSENAKSLAEATAGVMGTNTVEELFVPISGAGYDEITAIMSRNNAVILVHGAFDGYSNNVFSIICNAMQSEKSIKSVMFSIQGLDPSMLSEGVWNHAFYIDGDAGLQNIRKSRLNRFSLMTAIKYDNDEEAYKKGRKELNSYDLTIGNVAKMYYARYLGQYNKSVKDSWIVRMQLDVQAKASGNEGVDGKIGLTDSDDEF